MSKCKIEINPVANERVKRCVQGSGLSQKEFAEKIFCSQQHLSRIVNRKAPVTWETATKISELLPNISADWIMGGQYKSVDERITDLCKSNTLRSERIEQLMALHGYRVSISKKFVVERKDNDDDQRKEDIRALKEWSGSSCHLTYPPGISDAEILERAHSTYPETIMRIESPAPGEATRYIELNEYFQIIKDIDDYIKMRLEFLCRVRIDSEKQKGSADNGQHTGTPG